MTDSAKVKRFRVALSFPGEYRTRVERIAEALAGTLGRERVLYDKWCAAEFARPNLDLYLTGLYRDESDLVVVFLCAEYSEKEWCGLEWRACRELLKRKEDARLMFLRLDAADVQGLYSIDGYLDISAMDDAEVAAAILERLGEDTPKSVSHRSFIAKLPMVNSTLIGREEELAFLDRAWADPTANVVQVFAVGGTGKTALVDKWFRRHWGGATIFGWSFFSQGTSADRQTSSDPFFADLIKWFDIRVSPTDSIYIKAEAIARRLREERVLLILDGVEPLQEEAGPMRDVALKALLHELVLENRGLVVCTTRVRMDIPDALALDLNNLTQEQGAQYLRSLKVEGTDEELELASKEYWNHALALTLLGTYLVDFCDADVRRRIEIPSLAEGDDHARRVIAAYEGMFAGTPELEVLRALGYFDRPAEPEALKLVMPAMGKIKYRSALNGLYKARLILRKDTEADVDCYPLVREYFAGQATREGHARLYEHYQKNAPQQPDTLVEMTPLFYAVYHGSQADRHQEAIVDVYRGRICRGDSSHLTRKLGAFGTDVSLLANFFQTLWTKPVGNLSPGAQSWVVGQAGFALRAVGRLAEAVEPMWAAAEADVEVKDWNNAARSYSNLSELHCTLGNVAKAVAAARQAVEFADRSGDEFVKVYNRTLFADALHQSGDHDEAKRLFEEADRLQAKRQPDYPILYSVQGYRYCDLLLSQGESAEALRRSSRTLRWMEEQGWLRDIGLDHLALGRAHHSGSAEATQHLDQAVDFLRRAGQLHHLPRGLLARGSLRDLEEAFRIASRSGMRLFLADYYLKTGNLVEAERLINETGYHRRDQELAELRARLKS